MWSSSPAGKSGRAAWEQASAAQRARALCGMQLSCRQGQPAWTQHAAGVAATLPPAAPDVYLPLAAIVPLAAGGRTTQRASTAPSQ